MIYKEEWAEEICFTDDTCNQCWDNEQADWWEDMSWDQHKDYTILQLKLQSALMSKVSRIWSQNVQVQKQAKMHLLHVESLFEALFLQTDSKHVKMWSMLKYTQNL